MGLIADSVKDAVDAIATVDPALVSASEYLAVPSGQPARQGDGTFAHSGLPAVETGVSMVFADFTVLEQQSGLVQASDKRAIIPALNLTATPAVGHLIRDPALRIWRVERVMSVPSDALWILHVREYRNVWPA